MVVVVCTEQDRTAEVLSDYARAFYAHSVMLGASGQLFERASAQDVHPLLGNGAWNFLVFFGHGSAQPPALVGHDWAPLMDGNGLGDLRGRIICGVCCHSIDGIGPQAAARGATTVGFRAKLYVPLEEEAPEMESCALAAPTALANGACAAEAAKVTERAFLELAERWMAEPNVRRQLLATLMQENAEAANFAGDSSACASQGV